MVHRAEPPRDAAELRAHIIAEIKRIAEAQGGRPPGRLRFSRATGITMWHWQGVCWTRWNDAIGEAGYRPNEFQKPYDSDEVLAQFAKAVRHYRRLPTLTEMRLYKRQHPTFPDDRTVTRRFPTDAALAAAIRQRAAVDDSFADVLPFLPDEAAEPAVPAQAAGPGPEGWVYLVKSGKIYRLGHARGAPRRRLQQFTAALPAAERLVHAIRTDDPLGIEAYWSRRFESARVNGEWFDLRAADVAAFKRRKFM